MDKYTYEYNGVTYKVINPGKIIRINEISYQNQLEDINNDFSVKFTKRKPPFSKYGLDERSYYNLVVYGTLNHDEKCECDSCNGGYKMFNGLAYGYSRFCSRKCASLQKGYDKSNILKEQYKLGTNPIYSKRARCKSDFNRLMKSKYHSSDDLYSIYLAIPTFIDNSIKLGVTSCIHRRSTSYDRNDYLRIEVISECNRDLAARIEYDTKIKFLDFSLCNYTEVFDKERLMNILEFIVNELKSSNILVSSTTIEKIKHLVE